MVLWERREAGVLQSNPPLLQQPLRPSLSSSGNQGGNISQIKIYISVKWENLSAIEASLDIEENQWSCNVLQVRL